MYKKVDVPDSWYISVAGWNFGILEVPGKYIPLVNKWNFSSAYTPPRVNMRAYQCILENGIAYRKSPDMSDRVSEILGPVHQQIIVGTAPDAKGWIQVQSQALPMSPDSASILQTTDLYLPLAIDDTICFQCIANNFPTDLQRADVELWLLPQGEPPKLVLKYIEGDAQNSDLTNTPENVSSVCQACDWLINAAALGHVSSNVRSYARLLMANSHFMLVFLNRTDLDLFRKRIVTPLSNYLLHVGQVLKTDHVSRNVGPILGAVNAKHLNTCWDNGKGSGKGSGRGRVDSGGKSKGVGQSNASVRQTDHNCIPLPLGMTETVYIHLLRLIAMAIDSEFKDRVQAALLPVVEHDQSERHLLLPNIKSYSR